MFNRTWYQFDIPGHITWNAAFETLPAEFTRWGAIRGGNVLGVGPEMGNAIGEAPLLSRRIITRSLPRSTNCCPLVVDAGATWPGTVDNDAVYSVASSLRKEMVNLARDAELLLDFVYLNYAGSDQSPISSYGAANMAILDKVSREYDPGQMFQRQVPGGFKLRV